MRVALWSAAAVLVVAAPALGAEPATTVSVHPTTVGVGEPFVIRVEASPADARIEIAPGPFAPLGPPRIERSGDVAVATQRFACLGLECAPGARAVTVQLPPVRVDGAAAGPGRSLRVVPRVPAEAVELSEPPFRRTTAPGSPSWRIDPGTAAALAVVAAVALALGALLLIASELRRRRAPQLARADALTRALQLVRESAGRAADDRRRAAGLLARVLAERGAKPLAETAAAVAWSPPQPPPAAADKLAHDVERELRA